MRCLADDIAELHKFELYICIQYSVTSHFFYIFSQKNTRNDVGNHSDKEAILGNKEKSNA